MPRKDKYTIFTNLSGMGLKKIMQTCGCFLLHIELLVHGVQRRVLMTVGGGADAKEKDDREKEGREREREKEGRSHAGKRRTADRPQTSPPHLHLQVHGIRVYCPRTTTDCGSVCEGRVSSVPAAADRDRASERREGTKPVASRLSPALPQTSLIEQGRETQGG